MGLDEENKYIITINGEQVNIAKDNSIIYANQNNNSNLNDLVAKLKNTLEENSINEDVKNEIMDSAEGILEEISSGKPRKGRLKAFVEALKQSANLVPKVVEIGANIATIISFVQPIINQ